MCFGGILLYKMNGSGGEVDMWAVAAFLFFANVAMLFLCSLIIYLTIRTALRFVRRIFGSTKDALKATQSSPPIAPAPTPVVTPAPKKSTQIRPEYRRLIARQSKRTMNVVKSKEWHQPKLKYRYARKQSVMTRTEQLFYKRLFNLVGHELLIFPQIHLSSLFSHNKHYQDHRAALASIQRKSVDYILCDTSLRTVCAIELDDMTHTIPERIARDEFVNQVFSEAGLPILRISVPSRYTDDGLRELIYSVVRS